MRLTLASVVCASLLAARAASAQQPAPDASPPFAVQRAIVADSAGYQRLDLDVTILVAGDPFRVGPRTAYSAATAIDGLRDLRLYDDAGREVPYLLVHPERNGDQRMTTRPLPITPKKFSSGFEVDLGAARRVDLLQIAGLPAPFLKRARLEGSGDRAHWTLLVEQGTVFELPKEGLTQRELAFTVGDYRYLRLTWDDSTSGRMPLPAAVMVRLVPSRTIPPSPPLTTPLQFSRRASEPRKSRYTVRLPGAHLPVIALRLSVGDSNVLRSARVTEARLTGIDVTPVELGTTTLRRAALGDAVASALEIPIAAPLGDRVELTIDDGDNPPLALTGVVAVFADLPFVFFQANAPGTLTARYGAPNLSAPHYDLEALRDSVAALRLSRARWGDTTRLQPVAATSAGQGIPTGGAPIEIAAFRWSRGIRDSVAGLVVVRLDAAALAHSRLIDLRIANPAGDQVPYLLEHLDGPLTDSLPLLERLPRADTTATEKRRSRYRLRLPYDSLDGSRLVLRTSARVFSRRIRIEAPAPEDVRRGRGIIVVAAAEWAHAEPDTPAPALVLSIPPTGRDDLQIVVEEGDNDALALDSPALLLPGYELRFLSDGGSHARLLYGRRDIGAPSYDIALLGPRLVGVPATEVGLDPEGAPTVRATNTMPGRVFWGVLVVAVLILLAIIARLVRQDPLVREGTP